MSSFLGRLVERTVRAPAAGEPSARELSGATRSDGSGPGASPPRGRPDEVGAGAGTSGVRPRLPTRYERSPADEASAAAPSLEAEAGWDSEAQRESRGRVHSDAGAEQGQVAADAPLADRPTVSRAHKLTGPEWGKSRDTSEGESRTPENKGDRGSTVPERTQVGQGVDEPRRSSGSEGAFTERVTDRAAKRVLARLAHEGEATGPREGRARTDHAGVAGAKGGDPNAIGGTQGTNIAPRLDPRHDGTLRPDTGPRGIDQLAASPGIRPRFEASADGTGAGERPKGDTRPRGISRAAARAEGSPAPDVPRVQVTIGRVEVRAVYPAPPATSAPVSRPLPGPSTTLDDYLRQREGGS